MPELNSARHTSEQSEPINVPSTTHLAIIWWVKNRVANTVDWEKSNEWFIPQKYIDILISKEITNLKMNFPQFPLLVLRITEHMNLCKVQWYYSPLILNIEEIERLTNGALKINNDIKENHIMNFRFENQWYESYVVHHTSLEKLEYNPLMNSFWREIMRMISNTGLQLSNNILHRFMEISEHFDYRYGNGFASMTRMIAIMTNSWMIGNIFQQMPNDDIFKKINAFNSSNSYVNLYKDYLISIIKKYEGNGESKWYTLFRSGLSPRDKSCKDVEQYFGFIFQENTSTLQKKYRIIWDFLEKNIERAENFRTALSTKEVIVDGIRYPKWFLFRLHTKDGNILWTEPLRMTIFSSDTLMTDGKSTFWYQFEETIQRLISDEILPWNDLLGRMVTIVEQV